jgi:glutaconyl-CoA/methylmalonyl-CoA decarboxylase subunit delta
MEFWTRMATGVGITVWGMGLVFLLLALLWGLLTVLLRLDNPEAADDATAAEGAGETPDPAPPPMPFDLAAAITLAVLTHRDVLRKQAAPTMRSHWPGSILFANRWVAGGRHLQTQSWHPRKR